MRAYLDENLPHAVAAAARRLGLDVTSSAEDGRNGATDEEQLQYAAADGRCIVTRDRRDFTRLTAVFLTSGEPHAGVLLVPESLRSENIGGLARSLAAYSRAHPEGLAPYQVDWLSAGA